MSHLLLSSYAHISSQTPIKFIHEGILTFTYNPKDLKFIHHITNIRNLHEDKFLMEHELYNMAREDQNICRSSL